MIRQAWLVLKLAGQDFKGNAGIHLVALLIISAAFLTVGVFLLAAINLQALAGHWGEKIQVCVYLAGELSPEDRARLEARLREQPEVTAVQYQSREEALVEFQKMLGEEADLLAGLEENPLPASFTLQLAPAAREAETVTDLAARIAAWPEVEEVDAGGRWLENFSALVRALEVGVLLLTGLIALAVVFIISNTLRLVLYSRQEEIQIMRLVGASSLLIRLPFVLEGGLQGASAAVLAAALLWTLYRGFLAGALWPGLLAGFSPVFISPPTLLALIAGGAGLGMAASLSRFTRFLRSGEG